MVSDDELKLSIKKRTELFFEQTKANYEKTVDSKLSSPSETFCFDFPLKIQEEKWLLGLTSFEVYDFYFIKCEEIDISSILSPG